MPRARRDPHRGHVVRRAGARARRRAPAARRGARRARRPSSGRRTRGMPGALVADLKIARGLDYYTGHRLRDPAGRLRVVRLGLLAAGATTRSRATAGRPTPASASRSASAGCLGAARGRGLRRRQPLGADLRARRGAPTRSRGARPRTSPPRCARAASPPRWPRRPTSSASRSATPTGAGSRSCGSRRRRRGDAVKDIRSGDQVPRRSRRPGSRPARTCTPVVRLTARPRRALVIRTHEAGKPARRARRADRHAGRLGGPPARPRRRGLPRPARRVAASCRWSSATAEVAHALRNEFCVAVTGEVARAPGGQREPRPAHRRDRGRRDEPRGAQRGGAAAVPDRRARRGRRGGAAASYRYLDLRRAGAGAAIRLRSKVNRARPRRAATTQDFVEIETPTLTRSTPEGARDFLVPARLQPGSWYALPQSPAAVQAAAHGRGHGALLPDRALLPRRGLPRRPPARVHPARHRDELRRPGRRHRDRRGGRAARLWKLVGHEIATPIPRMTYAEAMARYGSDKPDLRFGLELVECTDYFDGHAVPGVPGALRRRRRDARRRVAAAQAARRVAGLGQAARRARAWPTSWSGDDGELGGPVAKNLSDAERAGLAGRGRRQARATACSSRPATPSPSRALLGAARLEIGRRCGLIDESAWSFVWIVDAPLFEPSSRPTTRRRRGRRRRLDRGAPRVHLAQAGVDRQLRAPTRARRSPTPTTSSATATRSAAGRSVSTARDVQQRVFEVMGLTGEQAAGEVRLPARRVRVRRRRRTAASPSAGTASARCSSGTDSIREVIAFPKTGGGYDPLTGAPAPITPEQRKEAGVDADPSADD